MGNKLGNMGNKTQAEIPVTEITMIIHNKSTSENEMFKVLLDSGTNRCMGTMSAVQRAGLPIHKGHIHEYHTAAGTFTTTYYTLLRAHRLLELHSQRILQQLEVQVTMGNLGVYDFIFGRDYMSRYGINLLFSDRMIEWDGVRMPMKQISQGNNEQFIQQINSSSYKKQNLLQLSNEQQHLNIQQRQLLYELLSKFAELFGGKLGTWPNEKISVQLKENVVPYYCAKPMRIPHIHLETARQEIQRLVKIGVVEPVDGMTAGEWCAPSFIIPKKEGTVRLITDFRQLNKAIVRKPWPMPHISDLIHDIGPYTYVTALDLSMAYYHFELDDHLTQLTTFILPFGLFCYRRLPMGLNISPDLFQEKMMKLFTQFPFVKVYMDDILIFSSGTYNDHLDKVAGVLQALKNKNLAINAEKSYWAVKEVDYLGFRLTPYGVLPQPRKVTAIIAMEAPRTRRQLRRFIGLVNYYRYMWQHRSHILAPLSAMASKIVPFKWTSEHQKAFEEIKQIVGKEVMLTFPDYSKCFDLYTDASDLQCGAVLKQGTNTLAFFSKKLNAAQKNYGVGEKEMLSVVLALQEFRTMVLGYPINVYVDHKNWTHDKVFRNARVLRWRLAIEEFNITFHYVKGEKNLIADVLSRFPTKENTGIKKNNDHIVDEIFTVIDWRRFYQPLTMKEIGREQQTDKYIELLQEQAPDRLGQMFEDIGQKAGPDSVLTEKDTVDGHERILVPTSLTGRLMEWYHTILVHPGVDRLYNTLRQHYVWPNMLQHIQNYTKRCNACQRGKRGLRGMGKVPIKDTETSPWHDVAIDLAGPWAAMVNNTKHVFHTLTIIDVFSSWVEIIPIKTKQGHYICDLFVQEWLRRYPRPSRVIFDAGGEFDNQYFHEIFRQWFIKPEPITIRNPRANAIVERMHRILGDMLRVQLATKYDGDDPIKDLTSAAAFAIRATVHGVTKFTPGQLVFSKDMILRTNFEANMELIRQRRSAAIQQNNQRENKRRIAYDYKPGDQVLILSGGMDPKLQLHQGPYKVLSYNKLNGTLHIHRNNYVESINIRQVRPYFGTIQGGD
jgi:transposase InsO family protein